MGWNTNLKISCAFVNDRIQNIFERLCKKLFIDIKYIDIAQNLTTQWAKMCNTFDFPKSHIGKFWLISVKQR